MHLNMDVMIIFFKLTIFLSTITLSMTMLQAMASTLLEHDNYRDDADNDDNNLF